MKTKMVGCGNTTCMFNNYGGCKRKSIILGANGSCLIFEPSLEKSKLVIDRELAMQKLTAVAAQEAEALHTEPEVEARRIGF